MGIHTQDTGGVSSNITEEACANTRYPILSYTNVAVNKNFTTHYLLLHVPGTLKTRACPDCYEPVGKGDWLRDERQIVCNACFFVHHSRCAERWRINMTYCDSCTSTD